MESNYIDFNKYIGKLPEEYPWWSCKEISCIIAPNDKLGGIYLGDFPGAHEISKINKYDIKAVLTCADRIKIQYSPSLISDHLTLPADDIEDYDMKQHFDVAFEFIDKNRKNGSVYVHCMAGISRSATIVIAYLMKTDKMSFIEAGTFVRNKRSVVSPNSGFCMQMLDYEKELNQNSLGKK